MRNEINSFVFFKVLSALMHCYYGEKVAKSLIARGVTRRLETKWAPSSEEILNFLIPFKFSKTRNVYM